MANRRHEQTPADNSTPVSGLPVRTRKFGRTLESAWVSLRGTGHDRNQDAVLVSPPAFAVADGVGGGSAGELASSKMLEYCRRIPEQTWRSPALLSRCLARADGVLRDSLREHTPDPSATTFAGVWVDHRGRGVMAHVGDARIIGITPGTRYCRVQSLTLDQTYGNLGETPPPGGRADDPARMLGVGEAGVPPVERLKLREGDLLLLCTDGLHRFVDAAQMADLIQQARRQRDSLSSLASALALAARQAGSRDDISVLLLRCNPWLGARRPFWVVFFGVLAAGFSFLLFAWSSRVGPPGL